VGLRFLFARQKESFAKKKFFHEGVSEQLQYYYFTKIKIHDTI